MKTLWELLDHLGRAGPVAYIGVPVGDWESIRNEAAEDDELHSNPELPYPHFLVLGVPIMASGRA